MISDKVPGRQPGNVRLDRRHITGISDTEAIACHLEQRLAVIVPRRLPHPDDEGNGRISVGEEPVRA
ncbi:hypothetical protein CTA1_4327 [Colletotrichum tanaceti]|uniref:Uncharacterized protein n=1 Tax=Colletotrichum tanaceti TaxID=1306861 RepID=A0A4U6XDK7_9PEZI|nr:hypothetical protein CTA1_4327 [Colletotrichum tanaceti]